MGWTKLTARTLVTGLVLWGWGVIPQASAAYLQTNLVANSSAYHPQLLDPLLEGSRSIAIRPVTSGVGGHFWINNLNNGTNTVYVGDVGGVPIFQDSLTVVTIPPSPSNPLPISSPTGQVFNNSRDFVITLDHPNGAITAPSKFIFASLDGTISAWTDRKQANGTPDWPIVSTIVVDRFGTSSYQGVTVSDRSSNNRIYAADFGVSQNVEVFAPDFQEITQNFPFSNPFVGYSPYNIQTFAGSLYITYAQPSTVQVGEALAGTGLGKLAQFDFEGNLLRTWDDGGLLNIPAGMAIAPGDFGQFSNALLVANFGDGTIVAFEQNTHQPLGYLRNAQGNPIHISGIWGLTFGNGLSLGETNDLYFSASPEGGDQDGLFGKLEYISVPESNFAIALLSFAGCLGAGRSLLKL